MRRGRQSLPPNVCREILEKGVSGVLAVSGDDGYPYAVPLNYVYDDGCLYFHSANVGHKIDAIRENPKVSFCVTARDTVVPEEYTSYFVSVIAFGTARILTDEREKRLAAERLALKYAPDDTADNRAREIERLWNAFCIIEMRVAHMTGKQAKELIGSRPS